jgi:hypothetical protein
LILINDSGFAKAIRAESCCLSQKKNYFAQVMNVGMNNLMQSCISEPLQCAARRKARER